MPASTFRAFFGPRSSHNPSGACVGSFLAHAAALVMLAAASAAQAQCPPSVTLPNQDGAGTNPCLCLIPGDQVGATFTAPAADYPLEILKVAIYWGSTFGGNPQSIEQAVHVYAGGLPNPGTPIATLPGPMLNDGMLNVIDLQPLPGQILVASGPFTVTLEILNQSSGNAFASSVVDDANGCRNGRNVVFTTGQWSDACAAGLTGDWVFEVIYRPCAGTVPVEGATWGVVKRLYGAGE